MLAFFGFLVAYAVKEYSIGYNYVLKSPLTMEFVAAIGMLLTLSTFILEPYGNIWAETNFKRLLICYSLLNLVCSIVATVAYGVASEFVAMIITILWLVPNGYFTYLVFRKPVVKTLMDSKSSSVLSDEPPNNFANLEVESIYDTQTHAGRCKCCALWAYFLLLGVICLLIAINSSVEAYNQTKYEVRGKLVNVKVYPVSKPDGPEIRMRINCIGNANGKATFLFEHGGGANGLSFQGIQVELSENGRRSCSYDRPGYGRSDSGANDATPEENARRTYDLLRNAGETGPFIVVGWSAGV